ncbi:MAG: 4Fe-4S dicluster domain-containing protein [Candidatus Binatia bacterium]
MAVRWGLFLCNCHQTVTLDPQRLVLPLAPCLLSFASHPDSDIGEFATRVKGERLDRVLISCCAAPSLFDEALGTAGAQSPKIHFVNLKESCFQAHPDPQQAHAKATRLLRAAIETAEVQDTPSYNPLTAGGRILIATDSPQGQQLAEQLRDVAHPILIIGPGVSPFDATPVWEVYRGRVVGVKGRLGDFHVTIENVEERDTPRLELLTDQVVVISQDGALPFKPRTGCHLLIKPSEADLDRLAERIRELIGDFLKSVHVNYHGDICAGGTADQEACGICISACPYDAIARDPKNRLRMQVDHMSCEGCGACASACPTSSLSFTEPSPRELYMRLAALLMPVPGQDDGGRLTVLFHCGEQGRRVLEEAGRRPLPYPASVLPVEVPCLRYVSEANILAALRLGAAGVGLLGCETCQHGERELLYQKFDFCRVTLEAFGLGPERLRLMTAGDGMEVEAITALSRFAETLDATPVRWDGQPSRHWGNREVIAEAITAFIEQTCREPGRRTFDALHPFAFADVEAAGCTMCRSCVDVCPVHAFRFEESTMSLQFKHIACIACGLCEKVCPENVITLRREVFYERDGLDYQTVAQDQMVSCAKCGKQYINRKALETVEARVLSLESLLDTFTGNRRSLLRMCPDCRAVAAMLEVDKGWKP